jgi:hypothetical protein
MESLYKTDNYEIYGIYKKSGVDLKPYFETKNGDNNFNVCMNAYAESQKCHVYSKYDEVEKQIYILYMFCDNKLNSTVEIKINKGLFASDFKFAPISTYSGLFNYTTLLGYDLYEYHEGELQRAKIESGKFKIKAVNISAHDKYHMNNLIVYYKSDVWYQSTITQGKIIINDRKILDHKTTVHI